MSQFCDFIRLTVTWKSTEKMNKQRHKCLLSMTSSPLWAALHASKSLWCNLQGYEERKSRKSRSVVLQCFLKKKKKKLTGQKRQPSDPYSYFHSFYWELSTTVDSLWRITGSFSGACAVSFLLHNYTVTLQGFPVAVWGCVVSRETHTGEVCLYCTHTRTVYSLLQKLHIQFKGSFFINLYLSGLSWLSKRAVFHYFLFTHIHTSEPHLKKTSDVFISSNSSFIFFCPSESLKHTAPVVHEFGDFSR